MRGPSRTIYLNGALKLGGTIILRQGGIERVEDWVAMCRAEFRKKGKLSKKEVERLAVQQVDIPR